MTAQLTAHCKSDAKVCSHLCNYFVMSLTGSRRAKTYFQAYAHSEGTNQPVYPRSLNQWTPQNVCMQSKGPVVSID